MRYCLFLMVFLFGVFSCDVFENEQEFDPNPECERDFFRVVEEPPILIGGTVQFWQSVTYPEEAEGSGVEGRVSIQFLITETGKVTCASVIRGLGRIFDQTAVNAVKKCDSSMVVRMVFQWLYNTRFPYILSSK